MIDPSLLPTWWKEAFYVCLAMATGTLSYLMRALDAKERLAVSRVLIEAGGLHIVRKPAVQRYDAVRLFLSCPG
ncbi:hypothetical protein [Xylella fastidiosa]|uniref:hypothetical protein n=1 Tax=Xylella fastidiosa TaxID=2371 RepID=UPI0011901C58|nr:hypothetical protein [Xylella fastidiosa]MCP8323980.1 hypothetical protein [Xylella fastidiosa subsp. multiplex]TVS40043.1 hypothetical protein E2N95_01955 [Xylella fastidiosa subsp. multiplex]TVS45893.1 hypothetical protein E2E25_01950 [Xylella fastidiosa subsp. multiplex]TVS46563.1 hypothetical protein E2N96_01955 [Xylella fastidiosa subsp. multiplex]